MKDTFMIPRQYWPGQSRGDIERKLRSIFVQMKGFSNVVKLVSLRNIAGSLLDIDTIIAYEMLVLAAFCDMIRICSHNKMAPCNLTYYNEGLSQ